MFFSTGPEPDDPRRWVNYNAFATHLSERHWKSTDPIWAIQAMREAHEDALDGPQSVRDALVMAAAQGVFWYGQSLFKQVLHSAGPEDTGDWSCGSLYKGEAGLTLQRWYFWRDGFKDVASGAKGGEKGLGEECRRVAGKAAVGMDALESMMTF